MLTAPMLASKRAIRRGGLAWKDIDVVECNEAFASVPMAWLAEVEYPHERFNPNGGGISLGHPIGATGARIMTTLLNAMVRRDAQLGLETLCVGGGQGMAVILERMS